MFITLPLISGIFIFLILQIKSKFWQLSVINSALIWGVLVAGISEFLSLFNFVNFLGVSSSWLLIDSALFLLFYKLIKNHKNILALSNIKFTLQPFYNLSLIFVIFIALTIGLIAITAPPNNWDSMTYHMPRVVHWIQNQSVAHYPTSYTPQIYSPPWGEYVIMHFQILSGSDRFANLVQWFSLVGSCIGVSLITKQLGGDFRVQIFSVVLCVTIPVGILHASNTNSTYAVAFWLTCLVYYVVLTVQEGINEKYALFIGISLGLAILTKGTAYIYALPFMIWLFLIELNRKKLNTINYFLLIAAVVILINFGHYTRNFELFGSPISTFPYKWSNDIYSIKTFISNLVRNISLHLSLPLDIFNNGILERAIYKIHTILGVNINDPQTTLYTEGIPEHTDLYNPKQLSTFEDTSGNPIHFWLSLIAIFLCIIDSRLRKDKYIVSYLITVICSFLLFCFLLKWQPWHSRLHLPFFILLTPFISLCYSRAYIVNGKIKKYLMLVMLYSSLAWVLWGEPRTIVSHHNIFNTPRIEQYFTLRSNLKNDYINAVKFIEQERCINIGLFLRPEAWEYPFWVLLKKDENQEIRIEHVNVNNPSQVKYSSHSFDTFKPCAIISVGSREDEKINFKETNYSRVWQSVESSDPVSVFMSQ